MREVERPDGPKCPRCGKNVKPGWKSCPFCRSSLPTAESMAAVPEPAAPAATPVNDHSAGEKMHRADSQDGRNKIAGVRRVMESWKARGLDVEDLEAYLKTPDVTPEGIKSHLERFLKTSKEHLVVEPDECPKCFAEISPTDEKCRSCGARLKKPTDDQPITHCPECRSRVGPKDRKCPTCGRRLKPWSLFS
jgi:predicted amidophosphoribosyltransferase